MCNFLGNIWLVIIFVQRKINSFIPTQIYTNIIQKGIKNEGLSPLTSRFTVCCL